MIEFLLNFLISLLQKWQNRDSLKTLGAKRSSKWPRVRREHLKKFPACVVCGETKRSVEVHHIKMFSSNPELELSPQNLITLCESGNNGVVCHRFFGHRGNYQTINPSVVEDAKIWKKKLK